MQSEATYWTGMLGRRSSRRALVRGVVLGGGGLAATGLIACSSSNGANTKPTAAASKASAGGTASGTSAAVTARPSGATAASSEGTPKSGGSIRVAQTRTYNDVMDPHTSLFQAAIIFAYIGNTALRLTRDGTQLVPELVEKWEIPGDGTEVLLHLHQGVKWQDRPPVGARTLDGEDAAYNLMRIAAKLNPPAEAPRFQRRSDLEGMNRAEAVDATTVKVVLDQPRSTFLNGLTDFRNQFIPRDFLEKGGKFEDIPGLIGSGPFLVDSFKDNERAVFKKNTAYWQTGLPYLDSLEWVWIPDRLSSLSTFTKGDTAYFEFPTKVERETLKKTAPNAREESWVFGNWDHFRFHTQKKPFDDARVRRAMQLVLNYKAMNDAHYGEGYWDFTGPIPAAFPEAIPSAEIAKLPGWNPSTKDADVKTAKQLLAAAGYPDGNGINFKILIFGDQSGVQYDFAIRAIDTWKQAFPGMKPEAELPPDLTVFSKRQVQGDFDLISYTLFPQPDAVLEMSANYLSSGSRNYGKFTEPKVDELLKKAAAQLDKNARAATMKEFETYLIEQQLPIINTSMPRYVVWFQNKVKGMHDYGGRIDGGGYDTQRHSAHLWLAS